MSQHQLLGYSARQSLISATGGSHPATAQLGALQSRFQIRNLQGDFDGSIFRILLEVADQADYIFWDLTDERLGVIQVADNTYVTRSDELIQSGLLADLESATWIRFGSDEHFELWQQSVRKFAQFTWAHGLQSKIVLFNLPWSLCDDDGTPLKKTLGMFPDEANNALSRYVAVVRKHMDICHLNIPWAQTVAGKAHKWGVAPYHYTDRVYELVTAEFVALDAAKFHSPRFVGKLDHDWRDVVSEPRTFAIASGASAFGLQIEARTVSSPVRLIISLRLEGAEGRHLQKYRITKSVMAGIGHFRYLDLHAGQGSYFAGFDLPEGVSCKSLTLKGWQVGRGKILIGRASVFTNTQSVAKG